MAGCTAPLSVPISGGPTSSMTVNLAPCEHANQGARYDLPVALGLLVASEQLPKSVVEKHEFLDELD